MSKLETEANKLDPIIASELNEIFSSLEAEQISFIDHFYTADLQTDQLLVMLGENAGANASGDNFYERGKSFFINSKSRLHKEICNNKALKSYCINVNVIDVTTCLALIVGGLQGAKNDGINYYLIIAIIVRMGIRNYCNKLWSN